MTNGKKTTSKSYQESLDEVEDEIDDSIYENDDEREIMLDAFGDPVDFDEDDYGEDALSSGVGRSKSAPPKKASAAQLEEVIVKLNEENTQLKDKVVRTMADMENLRQRTKREKIDTAKYAVSKFAGDILTVSDNLHRAFEHVDAEKLEDNAELKTLYEGVEMTERELEKVLERHGITRLNPEGERFDPNLHQAMYKIPNPDVDEGTVLQVVQAGYIIGDRLLRSAMVGIATGGSKPEKAVPQEAAKANAEAETEENLVEEAETEATETEAVDATEETPAKDEGEA